MPLQLSEQETQYLENLQQLTTKKGYSLEPILEALTSYIQEIQSSSQWAKLIQQALQSKLAVQGTSSEQILSAIQMFTFEGGEDTSLHTRRILDDEYGAYLEGRLATDAE